MRRRTMRIVVQFGLIQSGLAIVGTSLTSMVNGPRVETDWIKVAQRAFISFDYDHDARLKDLLVGQARHADTPFEIADWSIKTASPSWRSEARRRIRSAGLVIVLCGKHTDTAAGVAEELRIAKEEGIPYFLLAGYATGALKPVSASATDKMYTWTWDNLKALVRGSR